MNLRSEMMVVVQREADQRQAPRIAPFRMAPPATRSNGGGDRSSEVRAAALGAVRPRPHRPSPPPLPERAPGRADAGSVGSRAASETDAPNGRPSPAADHALAGEPTDAASTADTAPAPLPEAGDRSLADADQAPLAELTADDAAPASPDADQETAPHAEQVVAVDPYLRPALEAAAAAKAAAARIRESARAHAGVAVRPRWEVVVPALPGLPLEGVRDRASIAFRPLRRSMASLPDQDGPALETARIDHHLTVPPFARHEPVRKKGFVRVNGAAHVEKEQRESHEPAGNGRFRRFRAEVESASQQIDEDPGHPWAGKVPVPIAQAAPPRRSLWSRLVRLFGASNGAQETA